MKRTIEVEFETTATKVTTALNRFFKKHPELNYWKEMFEYMMENNISFDSNEWFDSINRIRNYDWTYALHLDVNEHIMDNGKDIYICVIERA